jgi:hypothetical protein
MAQEMSEVPSKLQVGINYPWINYGWDFGDPPPGWTGGLSVSEWRERRRRDVVSDLLKFRALGLFAVRWFVLADGTNYGFGPDAPQLINRRWQAAPLPAEHPFHQQLFEDFVFVLETCQDLNLKFVPALLDFHWSFPGEPVANTPVVKQGRADIVIDPAKREAFFDRVLEPLLDISLNYADTIYAWELINEPEWCTNPRNVAPSQIPPDEKQTVPLDLMRDFIAEGIHRINSRNAFRSTVGFAHHETLAEWDSPALGITLHQFHYYAQNKRKLPVHSYSAEYPCFIGEFASAYERDWPELKKQGLQQTLTQRLHNVAEKGYPAAFLWSARGSDPATLWTPAKQNETLAFLRGSGNEAV